MLTNLSQISWLVDSAKCAELLSLDVLCHTGLPYFHFFNFTGASVQETLLGIATYFVYFFVNHQNHDYTSNALLADSIHGPGQIGFELAQ